LQESIPIGLGKRKKKGQIPAVGKKTNGQFIHMSRQEPKARRALLFSRTPSRHKVNMLLSGSE
jgi:hypothetical protein